MAARQVLSFALESRPVNAVRSAQPALVILHGLFGSKQNWRTLAKAFARTLETDVYAVDLRNHGDSMHKPYVPQRLYADMAEDVVELLKHLNLPAVDLMGHSMGGKAAAVIALSQEQLLKRLVMVDIAPVNYRENSIFKFYISEMMRIHQARLRSRREADDMIKETIPSQSIRQFLLMNLVTNPDGVLQVRNNLEALKDSVDEIKSWPQSLPSGEPWRPFQNPTLFVVGTRDRYVREEHHPTIKTLFPSPQTRIVGLDAGHWVHSEQPQQFLETVCSFLKSPL